MNIRAKQLAGIERMLRLDNPASTSSENNLSQQWKVFIYDKFCRDIVSPLITVGRLRENGVTLHMLIESPRESIPDVPAVYFFQPTAENIQLFVRDCEKQLYDTAYLNFSSPIPSDLMQVLARRLVEINSVNVVAKVFDQYLGFVSLEPLLFSLNLRDSFARYNNPSLQGPAIEQCMDEICRGVCAVAVSMGIAPVIRCPAGGPAEMVARKVCDTLRGLLEQHGNFFTQGGARGVLEQRPMMLIVDRSIDMATPLMHTSGYQTLVDDLLELGLNRVKFSAEKKLDANGNPLPNQDPPKQFPLDKENDTFWAEFAGKMISNAVDAHRDQLAEVKEKQLKIQQQTGRDASSLGGANGGSETSALLSTVQSLPALLEKKKHLERHLDILQATMAVISKRQVHRFVELEENMVFSQYAEKQKVLELASDPVLSLQDKIRFLSVYMLTSNPSQQDADEIEGAILSTSVSEPLSQDQRDDLLKTIKYVKKILALSRFGKGNSSGDSSPSRATGKGGLWDLASLTRDAINNASRQVKSMVGESKVMPAVRMMALACKDSGSSTETLQEQDSQLLYMDPKVRGEVATNARIRSQFNRGILFVIGGGCYAEYQNLLDFAAGKLSLSSTAGLRLGEGGSSSAGKKPQFIYGCSQIVNATQFMDQLAKCA